MPPDFPTHPFALVLTDRTITPDRAETLLRRNFDEVAEELAARLPKAEISRMLRIQLAWLRSGHACSFDGNVHAFDHRVIVDEIAHLENPSLPTSTKPAEPFSGMLKGLWHKHFFDARMLPNNLKAEIDINFDRLWHRDFLKAWHAHPVLRDTTEIGQLTGLIAQTLVHGAFLNRLGANSVIAESRVTGEWLVFAKHKGRNVYLTVGVHAGIECGHCCSGLAMWRCVPVRARHAEIQWRGRIEPRPVSTNSAVVDEIGGGFPRWSCSHRSGLFADGEWPPPLAFLPVYVARLRSTSSQHDSLWTPGSQGFVGAAGKAI